MKDFGIIEWCVFVAVVVWGLSSLVEVARGTAHVGDDGCGCIKHDAPEHRP